MVEIILHNEKGPAVVEAGTQGTKKRPGKKPKKETELLFSVCGGQNEGVKPSPKQLLNIRDLCTAGQTLSLLESVVRFCCLSLGGLSSAI